MKRLLQNLLQKFNVYCIFMFQEQGHWWQLLEIGISIIAMIENNDNCSAIFQKLLIPAQYVTEKFNSHMHVL